MIHADLTPWLDNLGPIADALDRYEALISPRTALTALEFGAIGEREYLQRTIANTAPFDLTGNPALSAPCKEAGGNPVGTHIIADWNDDVTAVTLGSAVERFFRTRFRCIGVREV